MSELEQATADAADLEENDSQDFVSFEMQGEMYAFPMARVQEIIRLPEVVKVPLGPASLEGLANLRGRVLPVVSLRRCCGLEDAEHDEATRVVVVDGGATLGFVVDRVASVSSVSPDRVEPADTVRATVRSDLLAGVIKADTAQDDTAMTTVLDVPALVAAEFATLERSSAEGRARAGAPGAEQADADDLTDTLELVSFAVEGQEYALPIDQVQEIVQAPEAVSSVPNAEARVLGVMDLRGRLLPVVSLRRVFGLPAGPLEPQNRIVVVSLEGGAVVGVVMDTVREVLRVPQDLVAPLPAIVSGRGGRSEVEQVCRLDGGERLVSVLSVERMFGGELRSAIEEVAEDAGLVPGDDDEEQSMVDDSRGEDELLVVFRVAEEEYCVDVDAVQEIIRVPETLSRVPKTLDFVEGLVNLRGAVLPVVDLRSRLGIERCARDERQRIVVFVLDGVRTGFIVDAVAEVLKVTGATLEAAPELSEEQARLVSRVANLPDADRMLMVLEPGELLVREQVEALEAAVPAQRRGADELVEA